MVNQRPTFAMHCHPTHPTPHRSCSIAPHNINAPYTTHTSTHPPTRSPSTHVHTCGSLASVMGYVGQNPEVSTDTDMSTPGGSFER